MTRLSTDSWRSRTDASDPRRVHDTVQILLVVNVWLGADTHTSVSRAFYAPPCRRGREPDRRRSNTVSGRAIRVLKVREEDPRGSLIVEEMERRPF